MIVELNDDDTRLLYTVLLQQAQEHFSYADIRSSREIMQTGDQIQTPVRERNITIR